MPCPGLALNESLSNKERPLSSAKVTMASASGCSDAFSALAKVEVSLNRQRSL